MNPLSTSGFNLRFSRKANTPPPRTSLDDDDDDASDSSSLGLSKKKPQFYSEYFRRYELMIEFTNLRNPNHCPLGVYVMPAQDNLNVWFGSLFVHKGNYRNGVFKFRINIPEEYPERPPSVVFLTDMFHPLVDAQGNFNIGQQFPSWRPHQDHIFHVLHYIKNAFKKVVLDNLLEKYALNKDVYHNEATIFANLAQQCAHLSITESILFEHLPENNMIKFTELSDSKFVRSVGLDRQQEPDRAEAQGPDLQRHGLSLDRKLANKLVRRAPRQGVLRQTIENPTLQ
ncbi:ubiquitin-conjugating enzyme/RWD-like protein [Jimgerdemannia flammicorona]|uniref:Ubiquitin-conjugating enzyme/RWD-like protein n=1 Tax=Jimgerdemannia flammicorona TaxID=994334 RepID=A0A433Q2Y4_9FUNG|nr:ubiquitin-conjugating enzyme/RWD-like protein [Jimgerdemannia flammicorona]